MIQSAATTLTAGHAKAAGKAHGASTNATGTASFSAILGDSSGLEATSTEPSPATEGAVAALLPPVAGGNAGKAGGKTLPVMTKDKPGKAEAASDNDAGTDTNPPEATLDPAGMPLTLAGILSLPLPPLPGTDPVNTAQPRAAGTGAIETAGSAASTAAPVAQPLIRTLPGAATTKAIAAVPAVGPANKPAAPVITLAPVEIVAEASTSEAAGQPAAKTVQAPQTAAQLALRTPPAPTGNEAAPPATSQQANTAAASNLVASAPGTLPAQGTASMRPSPSQQQASRPSDTKADPVELSAAPAAHSIHEAATSVLPIVNPGQAQSTAAPVSHTATIASAAAPAAEGPQDFSTLVARLTEAREAASPHLVRTAISHSEFGQISLQFRHEDGALSVTMANSDPGFTAAVHAAANASLAGDANGNASPRQQQQQHTPAPSQQQAAASGTGTGPGTGGGNQQARADQAGQSMNRGQGSASRSQDQQASAPRQSRDGTRRGGGIYA